MSKFKFEFQITHLPYSDRCNDPIQKYCLDISEQDYRLISGTGNRIEFYTTSSGWRIGSGYCVDVSFYNKIIYIQGYDCLDDSSYRKSIFYATEEQLRVVKAALQEFKDVYCEKGALYPTKPHRLTNIFK